MSNFLKVLSCADGQSDNIVADIENMVRSFIEKVLAVYPLMISCTVNTTSQILELLHLSAQGNFIYQTPAVSI